MNTEKGFTLIELLIAIVVIGILAAGATTAYVGVMKKAARSEAYATLQSIRLLEEQFFAENADYTASAAGVPAIRALLPGFRPGNGLNYNYSIIQNSQLNNTGGNTAGNPPGMAAVVAPAPPCFVATAQGIAGTRVCANPADCDFFAIDCNNNRNF